MGQSTDCKYRNAIVWSLRGEYNIMWSLIAQTQNILIIPGFGTGGGGLPGRDVDIFGKYYIICSVIAEQHGSRKFTILESRFCAS